jgi:hypothetical protein
MTSPPNTPHSIEQRLLEQPRPTAGIDGHGHPVRLGERDSAGYLVGYIDEHGLAWQSLNERIVPFTASTSPQRWPARTTTRAATSSSTRPSPTCPTS